MTDNIDLVIVQTIETAAMPKGQICSIKLNRPQAINALNYEMVSAIKEALIAGLTNENLKLVIVEHVGGRGFCAGGDIAMLKQSGASDGKAAQAFFHSEYQIKHLIANYPKPYLAFMDGIVMGGGVGISIHGDYRIATENTIFAMPETGIGLLPDVGGGWFLPRLKNHIGIYLALTGARLRAADCIEAGIATHFVNADKLPKLKTAIENAPSLIEKNIENILGEYNENAGDLDLLSKKNQENIARHFAFGTMQEIFASLGDDENLWAQAQLALLKTKSPQTLVLALEQLQRGAKMKNLAEVLAMEYRLSTRVIALHDFQEGVRAMIIDKDFKPKWHDKSIYDVDMEKINALFAPLTDYEEWETSCPPLVGGPRF